jgi:hypothetical protein
VKLIIAPTCKRTGRAPATFKGRSSWGFRTPEQVNGICLHQTASAGGIAPYDLGGYMRRLGGTSMRRRGVPYAYVYSPRHDAVIALWHPRLYGWHGNGANARTIGFAIDGKWPGDEAPSNEQLARALELMVAHASGEGFDRIEHIYAHRQFSAMRGGDPGAQLWLGLELGAAQLGIFPRPDYVRSSKKAGKGRPIPSSWRPK